MTTIKLKRGLAASFTTVNPVLSNAEPAYEIDTGKLKLGDGVTTWNALPYFVGDIGAVDTDDVSEGAVNFYYTEPRFDTSFSNKDTDDLNEGANLYYTAARFNTAFAGKTTTDLVEGTGLYFTNERAQDAAFDALVAIDSATIDFTYSDGGNTFNAIVIDDSISNTKLSNMATATFKARTTAGTGDPEDLTVAQVKTLLNLTGTNSGDQTSIVGITGTKAQFNTAVTDGDIVYVGDFATGETIQSVTATYSTNTALTATIPLDDTIPQNTEGTEIVTLSITPTSATNRLIINFNGFGSGSVNNVDMITALFQDSVVSALNASYCGGVGTDKGNTFQIMHTMISGTVSAITFKIRVGPAAAATIRLNGTSAARLFGGVAAALFVVREIKV